MQKLPHLVSLLVLGAGLAACAGPRLPAGDTTTYEAIRADLQKGAAQNGAKAQRQPDPVADALLPPVATISGNLPRGRAAQEERFNVAFNNVPVQQFYHSLVEGTRYNMLIHPEVSGNITANLKDVTMAEALDAIREMYGYDYRIEGTRISIKPLTMQTRVFQVNYLIGSRKGTSSLRVVSTSVSNAQSGSNGNQNNQNGQNNNNSNNNNNNQNGSGGSQQDSSVVNTTTNSEFWTELKLALDAIVGGGTDGRAVVISPQSGVIVVRGMPEELRNVDAYLKASQISVNRQVILEAKILEVELNDSFQMGINWAAFSNFNNNSRHVSGGVLQPGTGLAPNSSLTTNGPPGISGLPGSTLRAAENAAGSLFGLAFQTSNFAALISFLESQGTVHVLSSPRIATLNNQKAVLKIGTDEFYVTGVTSTTATNPNGTNVSTPSVTLQPFFSGVVLDVTPQIDNQGNITLHVHPSVSQVSTISKGINLGTSGTLSLPLAASATSEMDSMVRGQDGQVVAIGGLMRQSSTNDQSGVPGAAGVPVLGALFRSTARVNQKRELVVLIKPTIVDSANANAFGQDMLDAVNRVEKLDPRSKSGR